MRYFVARVLPASNPKDTSLEVTRAQRQSLVNGRKFVGLDVRVQHSNKLTSIGRVVDAIVAPKNGAVLAVVEIPNGTVAGRTICNLIDKKFLTGISLGHKVKRDSKQNEEIELEEVSLTSNPARADCSIVPIEFLDNNGSSATTSSSKMAEIPRDTASEWRVRASRSFQNVEKGGPMAATSTTESSSGMAEGVKPAEVNNVQQQPSPQEDKQASLADAQKKQPPNHGDEHLHRAAMEFAKSTDKKLMALGQMMLQQQEENMRLKTSTTRFGEMLATDHANWFAELLNSQVILNDPALKQEMDATQKLLTQHLMADPELVQILQNVRAIVKKSGGAKQQPLSEPPQQQMQPAAPQVIQVQASRSSANAPAQQQQRRNEMEEFQSLSNSASTVLNPGVRALMSLPPDSGYIRPMTSEEIQQRQQGLRDYVKAASAVMDNVGYNSAVVDVKFNC